jgi:AcrR family transcriptional regulator
MAMIAEQAGVAVGTLYNRFKDRDALLQELIAQRRAELLEELERVSEQLASLGLRERLTGVVQALLLHCEQHRPFLRLVLSSEWGHGQSKELMLRALRERLQAVLGSGPELREDPDGALPLLLISLVRGTLERDRYGLPVLEPALAARQVVELFLNGAGR